MLTKFVRAFLPWMPILAMPAVILFHLYWPAPRMFWPDWWSIGAAFLVVNVAYNACNWGLTKFSSRYNRMEPARKAYTTKNIVKAVYLAWIAMLMSLEMMQLIETGQWRNPELQWFSIMYAMPDLVGTMRVPNLRSTTYIHHTVVLGLSTMSIRWDMGVTYWKWQVIYGYLSALTWIVNLYLGSWRLVKPGLIRTRFAGVAMLNYGVVLAVNWGWQVMWFLTNISYSQIYSKWAVITRMLAGLMIFAIAVDDIDLITSLWNHYRGLVTTRLDKKHKDEELPEVSE